MWSDGRTDMTKLIATFRNFAKAPKNLLTSTWNGRYVILISKHYNFMLINFPIFKILILLTIPIRAIQYLG